jgi:hypothetical protein
VVIFAPEVSAPVTGFFNSGKSIVNVPVQSARTEYVPYDHSTGQENLARHREGVVALQRAIRTAIVIKNLRTSRGAEREQPNGSKQYSSQDSRFHGFSSKVMTLYERTDTFG